MKSLKEYLIESKQQYSYRIKIAGELTAETIKDLKRCLEQFGLVSMSDTKKTPVVKDPYDFPEFSNVEVNIIDITVDYPVSIPQMLELVQQIGIQPNAVKMFDQKFADSVDAERKNKEDQETPVLDKDLVPASKEQKSAGKQYAGAYQDIVKDIKTRKYEVAGGDTPAAKTTNDLPQGTKSPIGS